MSSDRFNESHPPGPSGVTSGLSGVSVDQSWSAVGGAGGAEVQGESRETGSEDPPTSREQGAGLARHQLGEIERAV